MAEKTYLDKYETPEEKTKAIIDNLYDLINYKGFKITDIDKKIAKKAYLSQAKHYGKIDFCTLLKCCDILGVNLAKLMSFSYKNVAKKADIDAKELEIKELKTRLAKLEMQVKLDKQALNEEYQKGI